MLVPGVSSWQTRRLNSLNSLALFMTRFLNKSLKVYNRHTYHGLSAATTLQRAQRKRMADVRCSHEAAGGADVRGSIVPLIWLLRRVATFVSGLRGSKTDERNLRRGKAPTDAPEASVEQWAPPEAACRHGDRGSWHCGQPIFFVRRDSDSCRSAAPWPGPGRVPRCSAEPGRRPRRLCSDSG